ncbi:gliding motility-associated C-terminal domain-containing protein [Segetibacter sp. 3557_3]|uniref:T9SS type B sorting domain-containing protein n=1 Tax=Segetibacter sp. 3557_3 TaxID=2547429 RepID=UPI001058FEDB|nr:gliding motility-associated C-terminal domain-containing protein [Segetibacter sp. 3557_3]TDH21252.1 gliding motility-associated C-terminal domain-containing protein [Segetibacter sp. 3557_3]
MRYQILLAGLLMLATNVLSQMGNRSRLEVNEFSQGTSGNKEYIELIVVGPKDCIDTTMNIAHWIVDDQNGWFAQGAGAAISGGHYRFRDTVIWHNVPIGAMIVIYNDADKNTNPGFPPDDPLDSNSDDVYVLPISSPLLEYSTLPANGSTTPINYSGLSYTKGAGTPDPQNWARIGLRDDGDAILVVRPNAIFSDPAGWFAIGYYSMPFFTGPAVLTIILTLPSGDNVVRATWYFDEASGRHDANTAWKTGPAGSLVETPGLPNSINNAAWISAVRKHPGRSSDIWVTPASAVTCSMTPVLLAAHNGANSNTWKWSPAVGLSSTTGASVYANPVYTTTYQLTGTDTTNCPDTAYVTVTVLSSPPVAPPLQTFCLNSGATVAQLTANGEAIKWYADPVGSTVLPGSTPLQSKMYYVSQTTNGCESTRTPVQVLLSAPAAPELVATPPTCSIPLGAITVRSPVSEAITYRLNGGASQPVNVFSGLLPGTYRVEADSSGCKSPPGFVDILPVASTLELTLTTTAACAKTGAIIAVAKNGTAPYVYALDGNNFKPSGLFENAGEGAHVVTVRDAGGCTASSQINVSGSNRFNLRLVSSTQTVFEGEQVFLQALASVKCDITKWFPEVLFSRQSASQQNFVATTSVNIGAIGKTPDGCVDTAYFQVKVQPLADIYIPSAFTPNGDGRNDDLRLFGPASTITWKIYSRYGKLVFETRDKFKAWDGTVNGMAQPTGVYVFSLRAQKQAGGEWLQKTGTITLMR